MSDERQHELKLAVEYGTGMTEWACPICGHRIIVKFEPGMVFRVLSPGDMSVTHYGAANGIELHSGFTNEPPPPEDPYLGPFEDWAEKNM